MMLKNRNASSVIKGFRFQFLVALYLFVLYIKDIKYMNVEGKEDIEIVDDDDNKTFVQVKETQNYDKPFNRSELKKAFLTLFENYNKNIDVTKNIIFATNSFFPFGKDNDFSFSSQNLINISYDELSDHIKDIIDKELKIDKLEKFRILKMNYLGDSETKKELVKSKIIELLNEISIDSGYFQQMFDRWMNIIGESAESPNEVIKKEFFMASIIAIVIKDSKIMTEFIDEYSQDYNAEYYIQGEYDSYIQDISDDIQVFNTVISMFEDYIKENKLGSISKSILIKDFINHSDFTGLMKMIGFTDNNSENIEICKCIVFLIIKKRYVIKKIGRVM